MLLAYDRAASKRARIGRFNRSRRAEHSYARNLRRLAKVVGQIVKTSFTNSPSDAIRLQNMLRAYADSLKPWAVAVASEMLADVARRDASAWVDHGKEMGRLLRTEIESAPTGQALQELLNEQVSLITSIPVEAGQRVHDLVVAGLSGSERASEVAKAIAETEDVTASRATLIARTESARAAATLTMVRAQAIGSEGYIWRAQKDSDTRPSHRAMDGKFVRWDSPPTLDGMTGHSGMFPNCRCWASPEIPTN